MGTIDGFLIAIDAKGGRPIWKVPVGDPKAGYSITHAPLVVKDKVIVGVAGGEYGIRGFIAAYDAATGKEDWRFNTIPGPGEPGHETWTGDSWQHGGGSAWVTGSYDPALNMVYWGVGNPGAECRFQRSNTKRMVKSRHRRSQPPSRRLLKHPERNGVWQA
jgi:alcohol dehydrogenase (cytochrome c)